MPKIRIVAPPREAIEIAAEPNLRIAAYIAKGDRGASAYEIAVANGFQGTEQEWLDSFEQNASEQVNAHIASLTPHPAYDDMVSLELIFENGLI